MVTVLERSSLEQPDSLDREDHLPADVPPSYDTLIPPPITSTSRYRDEKASYSPTPSLSTSSWPSGSVTPSPSRQTPGHLKDNRPYWFNFLAPRTARENVYSTVLSLVRELVQQQSLSSGTSGILDSCSEACRAHGISFSSLLQETSIENHTPLYWAIIKRPSEPPQPDDYDLVTALLSRSAPLTPSTISDVRHACLLASDQPLFQRLRLSPDFSPLSGTDQMILETSIPPDTIEVENVEGDQGNFIASFEILAFQRRMRVSNNIELEFIARGRIWRLTFCIDRSSEWMVKLSILKHSPATRIDAHLIIEEVPQSSTTTTPTALSLVDPTASPREQSAGQQNQTDGKARPAIDIQLRTGYHQLTADKHAVKQVLGDSSMGSSLLYDGSAYLDSKGTLRAKLNARFVK